MLPADTMTDLYHKVDTTEFFPPFFERLGLLSENCEKRGVRYYAISGYRSIPDQDALHALGRTVKNPDGACAEKPLGNIVTKARGGQSAHNFKVACDYAKDKDITRAGLQPDWNTAEYRVLAEEAKKLGLDPGFLWPSFPDAPHVQLDLSKYGIYLFRGKTTPSNAIVLLDEYNAGGMDAVLETLYRFDWK
jgi:peptidoglycan L-alanyl-D-glutamate endopeptidase CwlK